MWVDIVDQINKSTDYLEIWTQRVLLLILKTLFWIFEKTFFFNFLFLKGVFKAFFWLEELKIRNN